MRHESLCVTRLVLQIRNGGRPLVRDDGRDGVAAFSNLRGGFQHVGKRQLAKARVQRGPGRDGAGHRHRIPAARRALGGAVCVFAVLVAEVIQVPRLRCRAGGVQAVQLLAVPQDGKGIAAQAARNGLHHREHGRRCNGRIYRAAAREQHAQSGLRRQRVRGGNNIARKQRNAHGGVGVLPIEAVGHGLGKEVGSMDRMIICGAWNLIKLKFVGYCLRKT